MKLQVHSNLKVIAFDLEKLRGEIADKAAVRALNRTATTVRAKASREIRAVYNLPSAAIKGQISITRANRNRLRSEVIAAGRRLGLGAFAARQLKNGSVTVKVLQSGGRKTVKGSPKFGGKPFIAHMKSGHMGVFQRGGKKRLPIHELYSIDVPTAFTSDKVFKTLNRIADDAFEKNLAHEVQFLLSKNK